jgi:hypothetical protein
VILIGQLWFLIQYGSMTGKLFDFNNSRYTVAGDKLFLFIEGGAEGMVFDFRISTDGRTLIIFFNWMGTQQGLSFRRNT